MFGVRFSAVLVTFIAVASAAPTLRQLRQLESRVAAGQRRDLCVSERSSTISSLTDALSEARKCRYMGLSFTTFNYLREKCRKRSDLRAALGTCKSKCGSKRRDLSAAVSACIRIGWDSSDRRMKCATINPLRKKLIAARARKCPDENLPSTASLLSTARTAAEERRVALGIPLPAYELTVLEPPGGFADSTIIILHGLGQKVEELVPVIGQAQTNIFPRSRLIFPQANEMFVDAIGARANSWWNVQEGMSVSPPKSEVLAAARNINTIAGLQRRVHGINANRILVFGVSQGSALALTLYLRFKVGAVVLQSGFFVLQESYPKELDKRSQDAPALVLHGSADERVPLDEGQNVRDTLRDFGRLVKYVEYEGDDHALTMSLPEAITEISSFFAGTLAGSA